MNEQHRVAAGNGIDCLKRHAADIESEAHTLRRHEELLDWATDDIGLERAWAEQAYDIAREEEIEPAIAFELIRCGVGIRAEVMDDSGAPKLDPSSPSWIAGGPTPDQAMREWRLRTSLRRLRTLIREHGAPAPALRAFADAPDVDDAGY